MASRGTWSGAEPFGRPTPSRPDALDGDEGHGRVAALTRARLRARTARTFWRAVPPVSAELHEQTGLRFAVGSGEAPVG
jgi:hypothetical protein